MPQVNHYFARGSVMIIAGHIYSPSGSVARNLPPDEIDQK
jgi:hypothetical protein